MSHELWAEVSAAEAEYSAAEKLRDEAKQIYGAIPAPNDEDKARWHVATWRFLDARARLHHARRDCELAGIGEYSPEPEEEEA